MQHTVIIIIEFVHISQKIHNFLDILAAFATFISDSSANHSYNALVTVIIGMKNVKII